MGYVTEATQAVSIGLERKKRPLHERILSWSVEHPSRYPWRQEGNDAYRVLIGEMFLDKVRTNPEGAYQRFIEVFPSVEDMKRVPVERVTGLIAHLGLCECHDSLKSLIQHIETERAGGLPRDFDVLARISGLERYHIKAVFCFGYGLPVAIVDPHVLRMLTRIFCSSLLAHPSEGLIQALADSLLCYQDSQRYNGALLDIAELICRPRKPLCTSCPVNSLCDYAPNVPRIKRSYVNAR